jgi:hypothetical protein
LYKNSTKTSVYKMSKIHKQNTNIENKKNIERILKYTSKIIRKSQKRYK